VSGVRLVGVHPGAELRRRQRLFAALGAAFPEVRFEAREAGETRGLDALVELGGEETARTAADAGLRALAALAPEGEPGAAAVVDFASVSRLDRRLHGQALPDRHLQKAAPLPAVQGTEAIARVAGAPVWAREGNLDLVAVAAAELEDGEPLRDRLRRDRSLALLPLVEMLRELTEEAGWQSPPLRAAFLLDDPNLHWTSYGFLSLPRLSAHAAAHGYHLALAMVPLDARVAHPGAARLLRKGQGLSLCVHGNDHFGGELGQVQKEGEALSLAAQALRRVAAFERRTGVPVSRVMVPPHEECSEAMAAALARTGYAAISMTRPFPWLAPPPCHWLTAPDPEAPIAGWPPADTAAGGLPVLLRHPFADPHFSPAELALRAYLDQPLILYGHHDDLAGGLDVLAERSAAVNRLGPVRWGSLGSLAAANVRWRLEGDLLRLRPYSRQFSVEVPPGAVRVLVEPPWGSEGELVFSPAGAARADEPFAIAGSGSLDLSLHRTDAVAADAVPAPPRRPWPLVRRLAGETRDRIEPARRRLLSRA
jgi:hypothetical protein